MDVSVGTRSPPAFQEIDPTARGTTTLTGCTAVCLPATGKAATIIVLRFVIHGKCLLCLTRCFCTVPKETKGQRRTHAVTDKVSV